MSLLTEDIAALFCEAFGSIYLAGTIERDGVPTYNTGGDITGYAGADSIAIKVQVDTASQAMRSDAGYAEGDVSLIILTYGISSLTADDEVSIGGTRYSLQTVDLDAANSHWICRGRRVG